MLIMMLLEGWMAPMFASLSLFGTCVIDDEDGIYGQDVQVDDDGDGDGEHDDNDGGNGDSVTLVILSVFATSICTV
jgi:hypothetical protein